MKIPSLFLLVTVSSLIYFSSLCPLSPDFHTAMGKGHPILGPSYEKGIASYDDMVILERFCKIYEQNSHMQPSPTSKIPKIIHQIWLGSKLPETFAAYGQTWKQAHPDWEYRLWTDADIEEFGLENKDIYDAAINYGERSDIARYEILYRIGGIFLDTDMECVKPLDILHHTYDFFAVLEPMAGAPFLKRLTIVANGIIGACPGHPILRRCIDKLRATKHVDDIILRTGPLFFTDILIDNLDSTEFINIVLPLSFFIPFGKNVKSNEQMAQCIKPETFGIHHWAGSWMFNKSAFVPGYKFKIRVEYR